MTGELSIQPHRDRRLLPPAQYGGNGITFSLVAAERIANSITGSADPLGGLFGLDR